MTCCTVFFETKERGKTRGTRGTRETRETRGTRGAILVTRHQPLVTLY
ncbi:hypothetical protein [Chroococcidiopsis thermalis]|nr:hypothetical protein [Chroococcidiopsis thermalis]